MKFKIAVGDTNSIISDQVRHRCREGLWEGHPHRAEASLESCGANLQLSLLELSFVLVFDDTVFKQHSQCELVSLST